ncbi:GIY-YIG nuclease family protein [Motiliproteus sp. SC1-56]|uniref:GIY-YIG nuclease family protein n=1 Tax=Motiliproteus sp. SC1-56 TaxID=2799565 RepID=UPI001A8D5746|nr:GIY-YIG nuclease family protein [Motiliproteus sp. SC1-56]
MAEQISQDWYLYIVRTQGGLLYTGITTDVERRFKEHASGRGAKFFRRDPPEAVVYRAAFPDRGAASREEARIKKLSRIKKLHMIAGKKA